MIQRLVSEMCGRISIKSILLFTRKSYVDLGHLNHIKTAEWLDVVMYSCDIVLIFKYCVYDGFIVAGSTRKL
jgi:hypothetical protein